MGKHKEILRARGLIAQAYLSSPAKNKDLQNIIISLNIDAFKIVNGKQGS